MRTRRALLKLLGLGVPGLAVAPATVLAQTEDSPTPAERAAGVTPANYAHPPLNILRYGAVGDGAGDDGGAIRSAWQVAKQQGGGTIVFPGAATYLVRSLDPASPIRIPQQQADGSVRYLPYQSQLYFQNGSNVVFDFQGSTLSTPLTGGGAFFMLDGCSNIRMLGPRIAGAQMMSSGVVDVGAIIGGSGYVSGRYRGVSLTGGSGGGAVADIVVSGGAVTSVEVTYPGGSYVAGDILSCKNSGIGGRGSGFSVPVTGVSGAGPRVAVAAPNAIVCTALSRPSEKLTITDLDVAGMYAALYVAGDPNSANAITHLSLLGHTRARNGEYGVALHNSGDDSIVEDLYTYRVNRPFFFYGVQDVNITCVGDQTPFGFAPVVKAYSRSTRNITIRYSAINQPGQSGAVAKINFQVQHDPSVVDPPPTVQAVTLDYDESNMTSGGNGVEFDYYAGPGGLTLQSSSSHQLFNNFAIRGATNNTVLTTVTLNGVGAAAGIDLEKFQFKRPRPANDLDNNGFHGLRR
jgi:hypothetical protein